ncbi:MAG: Hsp20/alpha crystallin family protein [Pirellulaceae bacterium]|nr:Hsp20/alpha crystallin family protein [Pirellulaceae bacterium]
MSKPDAPNNRNRDNENGDDQAKQQAGAIDIASMLGMGGILEGVSSLVTKFGELAEKGEHLRKSYGETESGKAYQSSMGLSVKFGPGKADDASSVQPFQTRPASRSRPNSAPATSPSTPSSTSVQRDMRKREAQVEMFEESDHLLLVVEMPGVASEDVELQFVEKKLSMCGRSASAEFRAEIETPHVYQAEQVKVSANNGVIEIRLYQ